MKSFLAVVAVLLALLTGACSDSGTATPTTSATPEVSSSLMIVNGVVVNELEVLEGDDPTTVEQVISTVGGVILSRDARLGTLVVWFPTHDLAQLTEVKDTLAREHISAHLVFPQPPTG